MDSQLQDELLQRYFDDELTELERESVRQRLQPADEDRLRGLERLHTLVEAGAGPEAHEVPSDVLFQRIQEGIATEQKLGRGPDLQVVPGTTKARDRSTFWVVSTGLVAAAAMLALVLTPSADTVVEEREALSAAPAPVEMEMEAPLAAVIEPPPGSEVEEVDFGSSTGTVFEVEGEAGEPIAVVWINDEETGRW